MSATKYCNDPDHCTYSDCPTAFCDRGAEHSFAPPTGLGGKRETPLLLPNDTKIRFCNALDALRRHAAEGTSGECGVCATYLRYGDGDLCEQGKVIITKEMCYADTSLELPPNDQAEASGARGRPIANPDAPAALPPAHGWADATENVK